MIVRYSPRARNELDEIGEWIAQDNPIRAVSFVEELRAACLEIGERKLHHPLAAGPGTLRKKTHYPYLIFFRMRRREVTIVSIRHGARDHSRLR